MPFPNITALVSTLDFIDERLAIGDTTAFVTKMTSTQAELEAWSAQMVAFRDQLNTLIGELNATNIESVYERAVANGFVGTEQQWLDSLSAYGIALANGFTGDQAAWLASLKGADGANGGDGSVGPQGPVGPEGPQGPQGPQGPAGADGTGGGGGVTQAVVDSSIATALTPYVTATQLQTSQDAQDGKFSTAQQAAIDAALAAQAAAYNAQIAALEDQLPKNWSDLTQAERDALVPGDSVNTSAGVKVLSANARRANVGPFADVAARDAFVNPRHGDYGLVTSTGTFHYYSNDTGGWVDSDESDVTQLVVPPDADIDPNTDSTSWVGGFDGPSVPTFADLANLVGSYPNGVLVLDTGAVAYRGPSVVIASADSQFLSGDRTAFMSVTFTGGGNLGTTTPNNLIDGSILANQTNSWSIDVNTPAQNCDFVIDFGQPVLLNAMEVIVSGNLGDYQVEGSNDNSSYKVLSGVVSMAPAGDKWTWTDKTPYRYLKLQGVEGGGFTLNTFFIHEFLFETYDPSEAEVQLGEWSY